MADPVSPDQIKRLRARIGKDPDGDAMHATLDSLLEAAQRGRDAEGLAKAVEDNLPSIDAERAALSPSARGALGNLLAAQRALQTHPGLAEQKAAAGLEELREWHAVFPGAEPGEVLAALAGERAQKEDLGQALIEALQTVDDVAAMPMGDWEEKMLAEHPHAQRALKALRPKHPEEVAGPAAP